ncbi:MAG TPA: LysM domain-containing protein [Conexibacter sp.]|jgi:LysM repeat protein|nr:LysM domain-containing protein [Conexibacter sp.]
MADRNLARLAAPLALLAAAVAIAVVVQASGSSSPSDSPSVTRTAVTQPVRHSRTTPRIYVVKPGDTLTVISDKANVTLETIQRLNPDVDPNALQTGQRLKLSP